MRLAIIAPHFPEYALRYAEAMAQRCDVLACVDAGQLASEYEGRRRPELPAGRIEPVRFKTPADLWRLLRLVISFRPDVVHFQEAAGPRRGVFLAAVARILKRSTLIVLTVHDPLPHQGRDIRAAKRAAKPRDYLRRLANVLIAHGAYCADLLRGSARPGTGQVIASEHGVILEPAEQRPVPPGPLKLYTFGRMEAYKGVEVLLAAAERLHAEGLPFELSIAGHGPELDRLRGRFQTLPEVRLQTGFVPPNQVIASIQEADCVVLPYLSATQSGVLAAAFAGHRFVIASETGGIPDVVTHGRNGLLVPPGDPAALADAVKLVAQDAGLRETLRQGAIATARQQLNWSRIAERLQADFAAALETRSTARTTRRKHS